VLAFAATGDGPFGGGSTPALLYRVVNEEPDLARVPARVRPLIERCLAKAAADRPTPADILGLLGDEVGVLTGEWLPKAVADTIGRYIPTIETPTPPPPSAPEPPEHAAQEPATPEPMTAAAGVPETTDLVARAAAPDDRADATQDIVVSAAATDALAAGKAASSTTLARQGQEETGRAVHPAAALPQIPASPDPAAPGTPGGDGLEQPPAAGVSPLRRWRWPVSAAAAVIVVGVAATILAVEPGGTAKPTSGPTSALVRITTRPTTARPTTTAKPSKTPAAAKTKKPARKPSRTTSRTHARPTPTPGYTPSPTQTPTGNSSGASTATTPQTPPQKTSTAASGPQTITGVSGATVQSCSAYGSIGSTSGGSGVGYTFTNNSDADIQVWYLTSGGSGDLEDTVAPNNSFSPSAETREDWMVANSGGGCIGIFTITGGGGVTAGS
jgi:hypothetical protein